MWYWILLILLFYAILGFCYTWHLSSYWAKKARKAQAQLIEAQHEIKQLEDELWPIRQSQYKQCMEVLKARARAAA